LDLDVVTAGANGLAWMANLGDDTQFGPLSPPRVISTDAADNVISADVNVDGDSDLFVTGRTSTNRESTKLFLNNDQGALFTESAFANGDAVTAVIVEDVHDRDWFQSEFPDVIATAESNPGSPDSVKQILFYSNGLSTSIDFR